MKLSEIKLLVNNMFKYVDFKSIRADLNKVIIGFFILGLIYLLATNPSEEDHRNAVKIELLKRVESHNSDQINDLYKTLGNKIVDSIFDEVVNKHVYSQNFYLYSNTKKKSASRSIGVGFRGEIKFGFPFFDDLYEEAIGVCSKVRSSKEFIIGRAKDYGYLKIAEHDFPVEMSWLEGINSCADLGNGWRLPTIEELNFMYTNKDLIKGFTQTTYWSSNNGFDQSLGQNASYYFSFYTGNSNLYYKTTEKMRIRAVKTI